MKLNIFSVFDTKAQAYGTPYFCVHIGQAIRSFSDLVQDPQSTVKRHPEDYSLYRIGEMDTISGKVSGLNEPVFLAQAVEFVEPKV